jgi:hypothetical protein
MVRKAVTQTERRSQRTTRWRYFFWNHANIRPAWKRGTSIVIGRPRGLLLSQTRFGIWARRPRLRRCWRSALAAYPVSAARPLGRVRGRPRCPVRTCRASSRGMTGARSPPLAGVVRVDNGIPGASVRLWIKIPLPCLPGATASPPPLPGGKRAVDRLIPPSEAPPVLGETQQAGFYAGQGGSVRSTLQPPRRGAFRGLWRSARGIAPAAARDQHVEPGVHDLAKRGMRQAPPALGRLRGERCLPRGAILWRSSPQIDPPSYPPHQWRA